MSKNAHLSNNGLLTSPTHSLLLGLDALLVHVLLANENQLSLAVDQSESSIVYLQIPQHHVQVGSTANDRLIHIPAIHLEIVEAGHQGIQLSCGCGG